MPLNAYDPDKDPSVLAQRKKNLALFQLDWLATKDPVRWYLFAGPFGIHKDAGKESDPYLIPMQLHWYISNTEGAAKVPALADLLETDLRAENYQFHPSGINWSEMTRLAPYPGDDKMAEWLKANCGTQDAAGHTALMYPGLIGFLADRFIKEHGGEKDERD